MSAAESQPAQPNPTPEASRSPVVPDDARVDPRQGDVDARPDDADARRDDADARCGDADARRDDAAVAGIEAAEAPADAPQVSVDAGQVRRDTTQPGTGNVRSSEAARSDADADADAVRTRAARAVPPDDGPPVQPAGPAKRRNPIAPVVLLVLAAVALWAASRMTWVTLVSSDGLTEPATRKLDGGVWFGALTPVALVLLAGVAAVFATRGWLRRVVGVVVALLAAVAAVPGFALLTHHGRLADRAAVLAQLPARAHVDHVSAATFPAALSLLGAVLAFVAGVLLARMPEATAKLSGKYDNPVFRRAAAAEQVARQRDHAAEPASANSGHASAGSTKTVGSQAGSGSGEPLSERVLWDALDAGADPTDDGAEHDR